MNLNVEDNEYDEDNKHTIMLSFFITGRKKDTGYDEIRGRRNSTVRTDVNPSLPARNTGDQQDDTRPGIPYIIQPDPRPSTPYIIQSDPRPSGRPGTPLIIQSDPRPAGRPGAPYIIQSDPRPDSSSSSSSSSSSRGQPDSRNVGFYASNPAPRQHVEFTYQPDTIIQDNRPRGIYSQPRKPSSTRYPYGDVTPSPPPVIYSEARFEQDVPVTRTARKVSSHLGTDLPDRIRKVSGVNSYY